MDNSDIEKFHRAVRVSNRKNKPHIYKDSDSWGFVYPKDGER